MHRDRAARGRDRGTQRWHPPRPVPRGCRSNLPYRGATRRWRVATTLATRTVSMYVRYVRSCPVNREALAGSTRARASGSVLSTMAYV